ncbi:UNVERIFIED_CONTAM: hypothetical protein RMT77_017465 [Armadillidium vulgare]
MISRVPALSITLCSLLSSRTLTANVFCFQDGICQIFSISLCHGLFAVENEEILTCYSNIDFEALPSIYREASYHELIGCWWLTTQKLKWFESSNKCEEDGGQLVSLDKFKTQEELDSFDGIKDGDTMVYLGFLRNGSNAEFRWINGELLERSSFMWLDGEPNNDDKVLICGCGFSSGIIDDYCGFLNVAACHNPKSV